MFRLHQRVCSIRWRSGQPFLRFGTVTKVTKTTRYVDGERVVGSKEWCTTAEQAFEVEYEDLFMDWGAMLGPIRRRKDWTIRDTVRCVCRVRRLERRLLHHKRRIR